MVEWKKLGDLGTFIRGTGIQKSDFVDDGYPCIHYGQIHTKYGISTEKTISFISEELYKKSKKAVKGDVVLATTSEDAEGVAKPVAWLGDNDVAISGDAFIFHHNQNGKYLAHVFASHRFNLFKVKHVSGTKVVRITGDSMAKFEFPLPPLSEQNRIVSILDTFTESIENLKKQISERKKQYEHYRDQLLDLEGKPGVEMMSMGELFTFKNGLNKGKEFFGSGKPIIMFSNVFNSRYLKSSMITNRVDITEKEMERIDAKIGDVFFTRTSETREDVGYSSVLLEDIGECTFAGFLIRARPLTDKLIPSYCKYCFSSPIIRCSIIGNSSFTTRASLTGSGLGKIDLPIPPLSQQSRIVSILDTFEASIANLEQQLTHRQKQYEYYRNMLLTFDE